jgi:hypothetical protein
VNTARVERGKKKESKKGKTSQNGNSSVPVAKTHFVASVTDL